VLDQNHLPTSADTLNRSGTLTCPIQQRSIDSAALRV
jgi:hypothetical protein